MLRWIVPLSLLATVSCSSSSITPGEGTTGVDSPGVGGSDTMGAPRGGAAGQGAESGMAGAGNLSGAGGGGVSDTTRPTIVSITPFDGATGVEEDADVVITFSEPMTKSTTQAAIQAPLLGPTTMTWNAPGTVLTLDPSSDLPYAEGADVASTTATRFTVTVSTVAADLAGNELASTFVASFDTLRRISFADRDLEATSVTSAGSPLGCSSNAFCVGDVGSNVDGRGLLRFEIDTLPAGITRFERATVTVLQTISDGTPYGTDDQSLGSLLMQHVVLGPTMEPADYDREPLGLAGTFPDAGNDTDVDFELSLDVTTELAADYSAGRSLSSYRLQFTKTTDLQSDSDRVRIHAAGDGPNPLLEATYLIP